jgi:hypothetical protein
MKQFSQQKTEELNLLPNPVILREVAGSPLKYCHFTPLCHFERSEKSAFFGV